MNANCIICSDLFTHRSDIYATSCGHLFHFVCLMQWIERSKSCPQCRSTENEKTIHRIHFNDQSSEVTTDDLVTLQAKVDNGNFQLSLYEKDLSNYSEHYQKSQDASVSLKEMLVSLHEKENSNKSAMIAMKEQIKYFKDKVKDSEKCVREIARLKGEIDKLGYLRTVLHGSENEVQDILKNNQDSKSLNLLVAALKKQLIEADRKKQKLSSQLRTFKGDILEANTQLDWLKEENSRLRIEHSSHEKCPLEIAGLKQELADLLTKPDVDVSPDDSVHRALESPGSRRPDLNEAFVDEFAKESPTIMERVAQIKASDSPYMSIKPTGYAHLLQAKFTVNLPGKLQAAPPKASSAANHDKLSIFKKKLPVGQNVGEYSYNGLGGHSKDDIYPQPKKLPSMTLKRSKTSNSLTSSAKYRKLAPRKSASSSSK